MVERFNGTTRTSWTFLATILEFLSRPCCSIPFFFSLFGLGGSSLGIILLPYRSLFLTAGFLGFAVSAYATFRVRGSMFNKAFFIVSFLSSLFFIILPQLR